MRQPAPGNKQQITSCEVYESLRLPHTVAGQEALPSGEIRAVSFAFAAKSLRLKSTVFVQHPDLPHNEYILDVQ